MLENLYDNGAVRRQDRLLEEERAAELLREAEYGVLSMTDEDGEAYGVPLNFVWDEAGFACENDGAGAIYIHCATEGKKLRAIARNAATPSVFWFANSRRRKSNTANVPLKNLSTAQKSSALTSSTFQEKQRDRSINCFRFCVEK